EGEVHARGDEGQDDEDDRPGETFGPVALMRVAILCRRHHFLSSSSSSSSSSSDLMVTLALSSRPSPPDVMTFSPSLMPPKICTRLPSRMPTLTLRSRAIM